MCNKVPNIEIQNRSTRKFRMIMDCVSTATDHSFPSTAEFKTTGTFVCWSSTFHGIGKLYLHLCCSGTLKSN